MHTRRSRLDLGPALMAALFGRDRAALQALLAEARPADLSQEPLSLYHAAACAGDAEAIRLLHAAGAPAAAAQQLSKASPECVRLLGDALSRPQRAALTARRASALWVAAELGHAEAVEALLALGVPPDIDADLVQYMPTPLNRAMWNAAAGAVEAPRAAAVAEALLAAGADVTRCAPGALRSCARQCAPLVRTLLGLLQQRSEAGTYALPAEDYNLCSLLGAVAMVDELQPLAHFAARLQQPQLTRQLATSVLSSAAEAGSLGVLRFAQQAAAAAPAQRSTALAAWLGGHFAAAGPAALQEAACHDQPGAVQLFLEGGGLPPALEAVCVAAQVGACEALGALLAHGTPRVPAALPGPLRTCSLAYSPSGLYYPAAWPCPVLLALEARKNEDQLLHARRRRGQAVTECDRKLLPVLEQLLAAGYRPAIFTNVPVQEHWNGPIVRVKERYNPIAEEDWKLEGCNRYLYLAIQRPDWSPAQHHRFLPAFKAAAAALLLAAHAGGAGGAARSGRRPRGGGTVGLASLPQEVLLKIVGQAAYPLSAWAGV